MPWSSALAGRALTLRQSLFPQVVKGAPTVREPKRVGRLLPLSAMADYREILHERLYVRVPGTDKLRKTAANRHKHLLANGWRELERSQAADHIMVKYERTGHAPMKARLPKQGPEIRIERRPRRDDNRRGGGRR